MMTSVARRRPHLVAELLDWLDTPTPSRLMGLTPEIRVEDFIDDGIYVLRAEIPGIDPDKDVEITVEGNLLTISGERREEVKERKRREFHYGSFSRTVSLPAGVRVDDITATYNDGVLEVRVPIDGDEASRRIPIQRSA